MADPKDPTGEEEPKKSKTMLVVIIAVVATIAITGGAAFFLLGSGENGAEAVDVKKERKPAAPPTEPGPIVDLDSFVVNIQSDEGSRFLKTSISVELSGDETVLESFEKVRKIVRNQVLMYLSSLEEKDLKTMKQKKAMQKKIRKIINKRLQTEMVVRVYFTEFVTQ